MAGRRKLERDPATGPSAHPPVPAVLAQAEVGRTPGKSTAEMLTFLDGIAQPSGRLASAGGQHFQDHAAAACFRDSWPFWRLEHAVRHNGHAEFRKAALEAQQWLALWIEDDPSLQGWLKPS